MIFLITLATYIVGLLFFITLRKAEMINIPCDGEDDIDSNIVNVFWPISLVIFVFIKLVFIICTSIDLLTTWLAQKITKRKRGIKIGKL